MATRTRMYSTRRLRLDGMDAPNLVPDAIVGEVLAISPRLVALFLEMQVDCLGCTMSRFCTLADLCAYYALEWEDVRGRIAKALGEIESQG